MKITRIETLFLKPRWVIVKVHTDEGIIGIGEPTLEARSQSVVACIKEMEQSLIGEDPRKIVHNWQALYRGEFYMGGPVVCSAISGIEQALWDITGKWLGVPVYSLIGGPTRNKIKIYQGIYGKNPEELKKAVITSMGKGFTSFKIGPAGGASGSIDAYFQNGAVEYIDKPSLVDKTCEILDILRSTVGYEIDIAVDCHGKLSPAMAKVLIKEIEKYRPMFIEEPILPHNVEQLADIAHGTHIPIATGERLFTKWQFREVLEKRAASVLQPDLSHAGGIMECRIIAGMAEAYYCAVAPHCPLGPVAFAACLQLDAAIPNFLAQEMGNLGHGYIKEPFEIKNGYIELPIRPGLGIELDDEAIKDKLYDGSWRHSPLRHEDGSVADF